MFSLRNVLKNKFSDNPHMKNVLMASGVVFPDIRFLSVGQEIIKDIVYDNSVEDILDYMNDMFEYWEGRQHREPSKLSLSDIKDIVDYLRENFVFIPSLNERLNSVEKKLVRLTTEQAQVMEGLALNNHLLIEGSAGTGKTLLAVVFVKKKVKQGLKVLYITYNKNLSNNVRNQLEDITNLKVINIHALFGEYVKIDVTKMQESPQKYFTEILPEDFFCFIAKIPEPEMQNKQYDLLVIDEGQDILRPSYLYSMDALLRGGLDKGQWAVFYDEKKNIYNPEYEEGMDILKEYQSTRFRLSINCRNTVQIGTYSSKVSGVDLGEFIKENGEEVQKIAYQGKSDFDKQIISILKTMRKQKIDLSEVVFLASKKYCNSMLFDAGIEINELKEDFKFKKNIPVYSTIQGFKGLDSKVVVLIDVDHIRAHNYSKLLYIAGTRARILLYIVASKEFWEEHHGI